MASAILVLSLIRPGIAGAQYYSDNGNGSELVVDKKVKWLESKTFWENISAEQKILVDGEVVDFKIIVENSGNVTLTNVEVTDNLPDYLTVIYHPGTKESDKKIVWKIDSLNPGEKKDYQIRAKINGAENLAKMTKSTNNAEARAGDNWDKDTASYWIAPKAMPKTGGNLIVETTLGLTVGLAALGMRKLARGY